MNRRVQYQGFHPQPCHNGSSLSTLEVRLINGVRRCSKGSYSGFYTNCVTDVILPCLSWNSMWDQGVRLVYQLEQYINPLGPGRLMIGGHQQINKWGTPRTSHPKHRICWRNQLVVPLLQETSRWCVTTWSIEKLQLLYCTFYAFFFWTGTRSLYRLVIFASCSLLISLMSCRDICPLYILVI